MSALSSSPFSLGSGPGGSSLGGNPFADAGAGGGGSAFGGATTFGFSIPQGDVGELDAAAAKAAGASLGFSSRAGDVTSAVGSASAGWEGAAESAFVAYAGHLRAVLNSNSEVLGRAFTALSSFAGELEHAKQVTRQAAAQCERYHGELQTQQGLVQLHGGNAQTLYAQAAAAAHPQVQGDLLKQAHSEAGLARQASDAAAKAQGEFDSWQKRGIDADTTYTTQAESAARQISGLAGELRAPAALPGGSAPVPITVSPADRNFAQSMLPAIQGMPSSSWGDDPGVQLSALNGGEPLTPSQVLAVYDVVKAQQANGQGNIIDGLGGFVNTATGGLVSFGNPDTARYHGGELAALIPVDPDALAIDAERGGAVAVTDATEHVVARDLPPELRQFGTHIEYPSGQPDFTPFADKTVQIQYTGSRSQDFAAADEAAGITPAYRKGANPQGIRYTWHHDYDCTTMQLVPTLVHRAFGHTGGYSYYMDGLC